MKHIRKDGTFVYYYAVSRITGESHGLRFSRGAVSSFRGIEANPEAIPVVDTENLPIGPDDASGTIYDAIAEVVQEHPEVTDLLSGRRTLDQVL